MRAATAAVVLAGGAVALSGCHAAAVSTRAAVARPSTTASPTADRRTTSTPVTPAAASMSSGTTRASVKQAPPFTAPTADAAAALRAAVIYERAECTWSWTQPQADYTRRLQHLATRPYARVIAEQADRYAWAHAVVAQRQQVQCTVGSAVVAGEAPNRAGRVYVRVPFTAQVTSTLGSFATGQDIKSWRLIRVSGRWLVDGPSQGG